MTDSKTATERLREILDARGVEYETYRIDFGEGRSNFHTEWGNDNDYLYVEYSDGPVLRMFGCTPEQAIAATLRSGECESRWYELFGTPEKAAQTISDNCPGGSCDGCPGVKAGTCGLGDYHILLEWLRGKAVKR